MLSKSDTSEGIASRRNVLKMLKTFQRDCVLPQENTITRMDPKGPDVSHMPRSSAITYD